MPGPRLVNPSTALSFIGRKVAKLFSAQPQAKPASEDDESLSQDFPPQERIASELRQMMERNVSLLMVFSGSWYLYFNYRERIRDSQWTRAVFSVPVTKPPATACLVFPIPPSCAPRSPAATKPPTQRCVSYAS